MSVQQNLNISIDDERWSLTMRLRRVLLLLVVTIESAQPAPLVSVNNEESSSENVSLMIASPQFNSV